LNLIRPSLYAIVFIVELLMHPTLCLGEGGPLPTSESCAKMGLSAGSFILYNEAGQNTPSLHWGYCPSAYIRRSNGIYSCMDTQFVGARKAEILCQQLSNDQLSLDQFKQIVEKDLLMHSDELDAITKRLDELETKVLPSK
jgi:hypothetical protein